MTKIVVAGSRDCSDYDLVDTAIQAGLDKLGIKIEDITEIVHGDAKGVDKTAELWAKQNGVNFIAFPAKWKNLKAKGAVIKQNKFGKYNANAGFDRNKKMAEYADALIAVDLNTGGTNHMIKTMKETGKPVYQWEPAVLSDDEFEYDFAGGLDD